MSFSPFLVFYISLIINILNEQSKHVCSDDETLIITWDWQTYLVPFKEHKTLRGYQSFLNERNVGSNSTKKKSYAWKIAGNR